MSEQSQRDQSSESSNAISTNFEMDLNVVPEEDDHIITTKSHEVLNVDHAIKHATDFLGVIGQITAHSQPIDDVHDVVENQTAVNNAEVAHRVNPFRHQEQFLNSVLKLQPFCYYSSLWKLHFQLQVPKYENTSNEPDYLNSITTIVTASTKLVHPSSVYKSFASILLSLTPETQSSNYSQIKQLLLQQFPDIAPNVHSVPFWSYLVHFLLLSKKEDEACKMLILASCVGLENIEPLLESNEVDCPTFSSVAKKLRDLYNQAPWSGLALQRSKFMRAKEHLKAECNKSIEDDSLWQQLFELYKSEIDRLSQCQTAQHICSLYQAQLEHFDPDIKNRLVLSEAEWAELDLDVCLFTLRKALIKFSKSRNKLSHVHFFAQQMYEMLKRPSKGTAIMLKFLANFVQDHILQSAFNLNYSKSESVWMLLSSITSAMHGPFFDSETKLQALQRAKDICDLGAKEVAEEGTVPHRLIAESAMLCLKITGQPTASREYFSAALDKYPFSVDLWLSAAQFERTIRQFKQAVTVFEKALSVKEVSSNPAIWQDYIQFSLQRDKLGNARSIYIRSLSHVAPQFVDRMWQEFLEFENNLRKKQASDQPPSLLTLDQLKQAVIAQQPSLQTTIAESMQTAQQEPTEQTNLPTDNAGTSPEVAAPPTKKLKTEAPVTEEQRIALPAEYAEQPVEALPAYVQPPSKFQRPAFRTAESRPSQHSDNLSIESPYVEALMQPSAQSNTNEKPVFGTAPRTLASVGGTLTMEQIKLLEDAQKLLLQRQQPQEAPSQPTNEATNVNTPVPTNINPPVIQPPAPTPQPSQAPQPNTAQLPPLLIQLSEVLQDPLIFDIVKSLQNIQILKEKEIQKGRHELKMNQKRIRDQLLQHHRELLNHATPATYQQIHAQNTQQLRLHEQSCREELAQYDRTAAEELERQTLEQQRVLQQAGVPGFFPSTNKADIELHAQLLKLILTLAQELEKDQNPAATQQRLHTHMQPPPVVEPVQQYAQPVMNPPITAPSLPVQPVQQIPIQAQLQLPPQIPQQISLQSMQQPQAPMDLLAALLGVSSQPMAPQMPAVNNTPQLSVQQITQMIGNLVSNTPAHAQGDLIQQIQGYLPMLPNELQSHILQTLIVTLQNQGPPLQVQQPPSMLPMPMQPVMNFPPNDTIVLHGAQGPVTVPLSMLNQSLAFSQPNMNQPLPPPQQRRNRPPSYQKKRP